MKFKTWIENQEYEDFSAWLQNQGVDAHTLIDQLSKKPPDHSGGNANFWYIPQSNFGLRIVRRGNSEKLLPMQKQDDALKDMNVGQPIANLGNGIQILKTQLGSPAGPKHLFHKMKQEEQTKELEIYKNKIFQSSQMPQSAYDALMQQLVVLNQRGYRIDPSKPGNILIDPSKGFNLVDVNKSENGSLNNAGDIIVMLMGGNFHYPKISSPEIQQASQIMIKKIEIAAQKANLPLTKGPSVNYSYSLAGL